MLTPNRKTYIDYLRTNPLNRDKGYMFFWDGKNAFCALGMAADCFGIPVVPCGGTTEDTEYGDNYKAINELLNLEEEESWAIWRMNDTYDFSFAEVADVCEERWRNDQLVRY